jgi:hypothetical protein
MSHDRDILAIPDSTAFRAGVLHERERSLRIIQQLEEQSRKDCRLSRDCKPEIIHTLKAVARAIREAP